MILALDALLPDFLRSGKGAVPVLSVFLIAMMSGLMLTLSMTQVISAHPGSAQCDKNHSFLVLFCLRLPMYDSLPQSSVRRALQPIIFPSYSTNRNTAVLSGKEACLLGLALSVKHIAGSAPAAALFPRFCSFFYHLLFTLWPFRQVLYRKTVVRKSSPPLRLAGRAVLMLLSLPAAFLSQPVMR